MNSLRKPQRCDGTRSCRRYVQICLFVFMVTLNSQNKRVQISCPVHPVVCNVKLYVYLRNAHKNTREVQQHLLHRIHVH